MEKNIEKVIKMENNNEKIEFKTIVKSLSVFSFIMMWVVVLTSILFLIVKEIVNF